jgi:hypothetical protein
VEIQLERGREYRFRYLVDGAHWRTDRHADSQTVGEDGFYDSVVIAEMTAIPLSRLPLVE